MFRVATRFIHVNFIPFVPTGSFLVLENDGGGAIKLSLSGKSWFAAWARIALGFAVLTGVGTLLVGVTNKPRTEWLAVGIGSATALLCALSMWWSYRSTWMGRASYDRAVKLAEKAGFSEEGLVMLELAMGRISKEDAGKAIEQLQALSREARQIQGSESASTD